MMLIVIMGLLFLILLCLLPRFFWQALGFLFLFGLIAYALGLGEHPDRMEALVMFGAGFLVVAVLGHVIATIRRQERAIDAADFERQRQQELQNKWKMLKG